MSYFTDWVQIILILESTVAALRLTFYVSMLPGHQLGLRFVLTALYICCQPYIGRLLLPHGCTGSLVGGQLPRVFIFLDGLGPCGRCV